MMLTIHQNRALRKFQTAYFRGFMFMRGALELPAQTKKDIQILKKIFDSFSDAKIKVFEWGSGFSSIYFSDYLRRRNVEYQWHSIDNNRLWHEKVVTKLRQRDLHSCVQLHLEEFLPFWQKPGWKWEKIPPPCGVFGPKSESERRYIHFPKCLNTQFDVIIIDARFRRRCLQTAREVLSSEGVVVMHDAQKTHYHPGLDLFPHGKFFKTGEWFPFQEKPNQVWVGSLGNQRVFDVLNQF